MYGFFSIILYIYIRVKIIWFYVYMRTLYNVTYIIFFLYYDFPRMCTTSVCVRFCTVDTRVICGIGEIVLHANENGHDITRLL